MPSMHIPARTQLRSQKENRGKRGWKIMSVLQRDGTGQTYTVFKIQDKKAEIVERSIDMPVASTLVYELSRWECEVLVISDDGIDEFCRKLDARGIAHDFNC